MDYVPQNPYLGIVFVLVIDRLTALNPAWEAVSHTWTAGDIEGTILLQEP
jgi:hypothetical protein